LYQTLEDEEDQKKLATAVLLVEASLNTLRLDRMPQGVGLHIFNQTFSYLTTEMKGIAINQFNRLTASKVFFEILSAPLIGKYTALGIDYPTREDQIKRFVEGFRNWGEYLDAATQEGPETFVKNVREAAGRAYASEFREAGDLMKPELDPVPHRRDGTPPTIVGSLMPIGLVGIGFLPVTTLFSWQGMISMTFDPASLWVLLPTVLVGVGLFYFAAKTQPVVETQSAPKPLLGAA